MKILAFEYACAGGDGGEPFIKEGKRMLTALLRDLAAADHFFVTTLLARSVDRTGITVDEIFFADGDFFAAADQAMKMCDAVWIIAPECGSALLRLTEQAERLGKTVIGSSPDAVKLCGDKFSLERHLAGMITMPGSVPFNTAYDVFPCVVKPVDGAGSENVFFVTDEKQLREIKADGQDYLVQPYIEGDKLSAGIFTRAGEPVLLGVCRQVMSSGQKLKLKNLTGPIDYAGKGRLLELIKKIQRLVPGLRGYWGIDFIDSGGEITLIEINPRLTTSYPIYSESCGFTIAEAVLDSVGALSAP